MKSKVSFLLWLFALMAGMAYAQQQEPEFVGEVNYLDGGQAAVPLEKQRIVLKTTDEVFVVRGKIKVPGAKSPVRVPSSGKLQFVVRAVDNHSDPISIVKVFRFKAKSKSRKAEVWSVNFWGNTSRNDMAFVPFTAKKFGTSSYLIEIASVEPGEYGITVANPNARDGKSAVVSCFGAD